MSRHAAVVLESTDLMSEVCGANDRNLKIMEELLETRILSRGNQLFLDQEDDHKRLLFVEMMGELQDHLQLGQEANPDLIRAVFKALTAEQDGVQEDLKNRSITLSSSGKTIFPRTFRQATYVGAMDRAELTLGVGPAGTGKTYLAVAHALRDILEGKRRKLVLTRPVVEAGERLGFLPGDLSQKINPYLRPLYDAMEALLSPEMVAKMESARSIEVAPLAYMRGRSLSGCYVILDEAQNTTKEQMKMFLTRIGEGSKTVITGDITQIDLPRRSDSGLLESLDVLRGIEEIETTYFTSGDVVRNPLVKKIVDAYEASGV
ncbi:MAG: PhoH family protein [Spirochaetaceae bacterium]